MSDRIRVTIIKAEIKSNLDFIGKLDPFVILNYDGKDYRTKTCQRGGVTPQWNQPFEMDSNPSSVFSFKICDDDTARGDFIGAASLPFEEIRKKLEDYGMAFLKLRFTGPEYEGTLALEIMKLES